MAKGRVWGLRGGLGILAILALVLLGGGVAAQGPTGEATAQDGRSLAGESLETQNRFRIVWGEKAAAEWVAEHNAEIQAIGRAPAPGVVPTPAGTTPGPTGSAMGAAGAARLTATRGATAVVATASATAVSATPSATAVVAVASATPTPASGSMTVVAGRGPPPDPERASYPLLATSVALTLKGEIATLADGSILLTGRVGALGPRSPHGDGILRIDPSGVVRTLVGPSPGRGDGGPATDALLTPAGLAYDSDGGLIVADGANGVRRIEPSGIIRSLVPSVPSSQCQARHTRSLCNAADVALGPGGTLYIADSAADAVYQLGADGRLEVFAGGPEPRERPSAGAATAAVGAALLRPSRLALGPDGSVFIGERGRVSRVTADGLLHTVAGTGERPPLASNGVEGDGGRATDARVGNIGGLAVTPDGSVYIVDATLRRLRRVTPDGIIREVTLQNAPANNTLQAVTTGPDGSLYAVHAFAVHKVAPDGTLTEVASRIQVGPRDPPAYRNNNQGVAFLACVAVAPDGTLYAADMGRGRIQRIRQDGTVDHLAGAPAALQPGASTLNRRPDGLDHLVATPDGTIYFDADERAWKLGPDGALSEFLGTGVFPLGAGRDGSLHYVAEHDRTGGLHRQSKDGTTRVLPGFGTVWGPANAPLQLDALGMLSVADNGTIYATDIVGKRVWRVQPDGTAASIYSGDPDSIALDQHGRVFVSTGGFGTGGSSRIDVVNADGSVARFAGTGVVGDGGDGGPATNALLAHPAGLASAPDGSLLIVDRANNRVRQVTPDGTIRTLAGVNYGGNRGDSALNTHLHTPRGLAIASDGSIVAADAGTYRVRRIGSDGSVSTIGGSGAREPVEAPTAVESASSASITPGGVALAADGSVYATGDNSLLTRADFVFHVVGDELRREAAPINTVGIALTSGGEVIVVGGNMAKRRSKDGVWTTIAGAARGGYNGDEQPAVNAELSGPSAVAIGPDASVYIADTGNNRVRRITQDGRIHTVAGSGETGFSGDGGLATEAQLDTPAGIVVAADGTLFIADSHNERVRRVTPDGTIDTVAGSGLVGDGPAGAPATQVDLNDPSGLALGPDGSLYIADTGNGRIRRLWGCLHALKSHSVIGSERRPARKLERPATAMPLAGAAGEPAGDA